MSRKFREGTWHNFRGGGGGKRVVFGSSFYSGEFSTISPQLGFCYTFTASFNLVFFTSKGMQSRPKRCTVKWKANHSPNEGDTKVSDLIYLDNPIMQGRHWILYILIIIICILYIYSSLRKHADTLLGVPICFDLHHSTFLLTHNKRESNWATL